MNPVRGIARRLGRLMRPGRRAPARPGQLNEAVNYDLRTIFVAIPKTGTKTVRAQLRPAGEFLLWQPHLDIREIRDAMLTWELVEALGENRSFPTAGVRRYDEVVAVAGEKFDGFFKFAGVRNPWARAVSLYYRSEGLQVGGRMSFREFCEGHRFASDTCLFPTLHRNQVDWLTDESGELAVDYVYRIEDFEDAIAEIRERTDGRIALRPIERNRNPRSRSRRYQELYDDHTRTLIAERFEKDIDRFGYTFD